MAFLWALLALVALWCTLRALRACIPEPGKPTSNKLRIFNDASSRLDYTEEDCVNSSRNQNVPDLSGQGKSPYWLTTYRSRPATVHEIGRIEPVHIVCIGHCRPHHFISDDVLDIPGFKVCAEPNYRELVLKFQGIPAMILVHDSFPQAEVEDACRFIRRRWPRTRILVVHDREDFLEDSLYDDRVGTDVSKKDLIARILFLVQTTDLWSLRAG